jgi:hypothetical protein
MTPAARALETVTAPVLARIWPAAKVLSPAFLNALCERTFRQAESIDMRCRPAEP